MSVPRSCDRSMSRASRMAEAVGMGEGTIYPLMRRMQNDGLVSTYLQESESGPPRKYYRLTKSGALALKNQVAEWMTFEAAVRMRDRDRILMHVQTDEKGCRLCHG